jgi:hypothetical protein
VDVDVGAVARRECPLAGVLCIDRDMAGGAIPALRNVRLDKGGIR